MTLRDRLSRLTFRQTVDLLGTGGNKLIMQGGKISIDTSTGIEVSSNVFRAPVEDVLVSIVEDDRSEKKMRFFCSECDGLCEHIGAVFSLILEEKSVLGLAKPPEDEDEQADLSESELVKRELARRIDRAHSERLKLKSSDPRRMWTDYTISSPLSGKSYRIALRGWERGESYCTCPDFRKNTLGTCKHILFAMEKVRKDFPSWKRQAAFVPAAIAVYVRYADEMELWLQAPPRMEPFAQTRFQPFVGKAIGDLDGLMKAVSECTAQGIDVIIFPDAEQHINLELHRRKFERLVEEIRRAPDKHPMRTSLLKVELLPYQLDGIAFIAGKGRAVLADDMGLGKTIQGIGAAELLARECGISRVLVVCPASVKAQWRNEINRFCDRSSQIVVGTAKERAEQYQGSVFYTICNYEQVIRDLQFIEIAPWDFIILDEGQRIKNWEAKTSRTIKALRSRFALVLSGTPLENRLEELYSVMEFIDDRRLGPDFRFHSRHRVSSGSGRVLGYKNLDALRKLLAPVLLRRTRGAILKQLPPRTTEIVRIVPTAEQMDIHSSQSKIISQIVRKPYLTEMDLLRLQKALLICRMVADGTFLVNKQEPNYSTKLERLAEMLPQLAAEEGRKIVLFSEWTIMLDLIGKTILQPRGIRFVRLDGSVPQKKRQGLVHEFQTDPACTFFIATNAGATGLNLQAANTVVNVDLPWNPAILEQRIGRAHRMGQKRPVQVYLLVTEQTIEENMLSTLAAKHDLSQAALDIESDVTKVDLKSGIDELKRRLELLLGNQPSAPVDVSEKMRVEKEASDLAQRQRMQDAGGKLVVAAFSFLSEMLPAGREVVPENVEAVRKNLETCMEKGEDGSMSLRLRLPDAGALEGFARAVAGLMGGGVGKIGDGI